MAVINCGSFCIWEKQNKSLPVLVGCVCFQVKVTLLHFDQDLRARDEMGIKMQSAGSNSLMFSILSSLSTVTCKTLQCQEV